MAESVAISDVFAFKGLKPGENVEIGPPMAGMASVIISPSKEPNEHSLIINLKNFQSKDKFEVLHVPGAGRAVDTLDINVYRDKQKISYRLSNKESSRAVGNVKIVTGYNDSKPIIISTDDKNLVDKVKQGIANKKAEFMLQVSSPAPENLLDPVKPSALVMAAGIKYIG